MNAKFKSALINIGLMAVTVVAAVLIGSQAPRLYQEWKGNSRKGDFAAHVAKQPHRLTLYGTSTCAYCIKARAFLKKNNILFNDLVVDKTPEAQALYNQLNEQVVPVLVSEKTLIVGFTEKEYAEMIKEMGMQ